MGVSSSTAQAEGTCSSFALASQNLEHHLERLDMPSLFCGMDFHCSLLSPETPERLRWNK